MWSRNVATNFRTIKHLQDKNNGEFLYLIYSILDFKHKYVPVQTKCNLSLSSP